MKIMIDLNVLVDVLQRRTAFLIPSAKVCDAVRAGRCEGFVAAHAVTTLFYLIRRGQDSVTAERALDWLLSTFDIAPADKSIMLAARLLSFTDFEDAVVSASAVARSCDYIVTRNLGDYRNSPVNAVAPEEFLQTLNRPLMP